MATIPLAQRFAEMSAARDVPEDSETDAVGYETADGYVTEVVSRSPNRHTITKRVTVTQGEGSFTATAPKLSYSPLPSTNISSKTSEVDGQEPYRPSSDALGRASRPLPQGTLGAKSVLSGVSVDSQRVPSFTPPQATRWQSRRADEPAESPSPTVPREVESLGNLRWVTTVPHQSTTPTPQRQNGTRSPPPQTSAARSSAAKAVRIGNITNTTLIEPSRVSPLQVREAYAPVRYVSKRELRKMRDYPPDDDIPSQPQRLRRKGSVPQLDSFLDEQLLLQQQHVGREFNPRHGGVGPEYDEPQWDQRRSDARSPYRSGSVGSRRSHSAPRPFDNIRASPRIPYHQHRGGWQEGDVGAAGSRPVDDRDWAVDDDGASDFAPSVSSRGSFALGGALAGASMPAVRYPSTPVRGGSWPGGSAVTTLDHLPGHVHVMDFAERIAFCHRLKSIPQSPPQCNDAFRLLFRGTYVVKYGRQGNPHERFMAVRIVETERTRSPQPFLVWSTHAEAASFKERLHLALLLEVIPGTSCTNFQRHVLTQDTIAGPNVHGQRTVLPSRYAFTLSFVMGVVRRTVDCLCLDEQTFHCWLLVCQYFASINNCAGGEVPLDAETLAPDTPRSMSEPR